MLLNSTLRLGYLEADLQSTLKLERRPSTRGAPGSSPPLLPEGTKSPAQMRRKGSKERSLSQDPSRGRLDDRRSLSREGSKSKELSLDWTHVPHKEIHNDGPVMYSVSTPATNGPRSHQPHLVRTTRIEPTAYSKRRPPIPPKREIPREQITVTEKDLMRCGSDLKKLRECQIVQQEPVERTLPAPLPPPTPLELSFKSKFAQDCREGADPRDPWKDLKHPDEDRVLTVEDLVLNQVYIKALLPRKMEVDTSNSPEHRGRKTMSSKLRRSLSASTRASSADLGRQTWHDGQTRKSSKSTKRASSLGRGESFEDDVARTGSAIQPVSTDTPRTSREDETPEAKRAAREFLKGAHKRGETRSVWMALDERTGDVQLFQNTAGSRVEAAYRSGRSSVPLVGLKDPEVEGAIVTFDRASDSARVKQMDGKQAEVKRFEVTAYSYEMTIQVVTPSPGERCWRFARPGDLAEERLVQLFGTELVAPPSPTLPPVSRSRPTYFINEGALWGYD